MAFVTRSDQTTDANERPAAIRDRFIPRLHTMRAQSRPP